MHLMSCPSIVFWKTSILICPFVYQHKECRHSDEEVQFGLIIAIEFIGPFLVLAKSSGACYIITIAEYVTKWEEEEPVETYSMK